jgi:DNA-binding MarR family transcriptional regulator
VAMSTTTATVDETTRLYLAVGRLSRILRRSGSPGLGQGSISALATLAYKGPMRLGDLAAREGVAPPTLSRIIAALVESGYVMREADPQDGRASLVRATTAGEQIIAGVRSERLHELHNRLERLTDEQRTALAAAVPALEALVAEDV